MFKTLNSDMIEDSVYIQRWLEQFAPSDRMTAESLLLNLRFISRDEYSKWLLLKLSKYVDNQPCAIYAIRKFEKGQNSLWKQCGRVQYRPPQTQGSEDLVALIISNASRQYHGAFLDHPSLKDLREKKIRDILLIDDSIGSGDRVSKFIKLMTNHPTFNSWWSAGFVKIHVLSFARTTQSRNNIYDKVPGSDHGKRKFRLSKKLLFDSDFPYAINNIQRRWGLNADDISGLCDRAEQIPKDRRRGYGGVMSNIIFYHSVPNNIPGVLFCKRKNWDPLFPKRGLPNWCEEMLEKYGSKKQEEQVLNKKFQLQISREAVDLLYSIKKGIRTKTALARRIERDCIFVFDELQKLIQMHLVTDSIRLTKTGNDYLKRNKGDIRNKRLDYSLYIPKSWCAGQVDIQPSVNEVHKPHEQTDSAQIHDADGDSGELSLERTDAMATLSPSSVITQVSSLPRKSDDADGPEGLNE